MVYIYRTLWALGVILPKLDARHNRCWTLQRRNKTFLNGRKTSLIGVIVVGFLVYVTSRTLSHEKDSVAKNTLILSHYRYNESIIKI